jgi:hypothetical protein
MQRDADHGSAGAAAPAAYRLGRADVVTWREPRSRVVDAHPGRDERPAQYERELDAVGVGGGVGLRAVRAPLLELAGGERPSGPAVRL